MGLPAAPAWRQDTVLAKLGATNRREAATLAARHGLV
jgi:hypothetical protein